MKNNSHQPTAKTNEPPIVSCPSCQLDVAWTESNHFRPFCSESCKNKDFVDWANEEKRITGSSTYDDVFSEELNKHPAAD